MTFGPQCATCEPGTYNLSGNCVPCKCNQHGSCDPSSGVCHCDYSTTGSDCSMCAVGFYGNATNGGVCYTYCSTNLTRVLLTNITGALSSGPTITCPSSNVYSKSCYPSSTTCLFEIVSPFPNSTITLTFESFATECGFDFVHVFDGSDTNASALGAFSGSSIPSILRATSGNMTIHFLSDQSFALSGWKAHYVIEYCPSNCSDIGICSSGRCHCPHKYSGIDCSIVSCPSNCSYSLKRGECDEILNRCVCSDNHGGLDCKQLTRNNGSMIALPSVLPWSVYGHTTVYEPSFDRLWIFGGYIEALQSPVNWMAYFDFQTQIWTNATSPAGSTAPASRYQHAAAIGSDGNMYVFGGRNQSNALDDFWVFNFQTGQWTELSPWSLNLHTSIDPVPVFGHTITAASDGLFVFGGIGEINRYPVQFHVYNVSTQTWKACY